MNILPFYTRHFIEHFADGEMEVLLVVETFNELGDSTPQKHQLNAVMMQNHIPLFHSLCPSPSSCHFESLITSFYRSIRFKNVIKRHACTWLQAYTAVVMCIYISSRGSIISFCRFRTEALNSEAVDRTRNPAHFDL
jgi:hypothetical protein